MPKCQSCADVGRRGSCSPGRCYCGHEDCHAFASWTPLRAPDLVAVKPKKRDTSAWDERSGTGWIDKL